MPKVSFRSQIPMAGQVRVNCPNCGQTTDIDAELLWLMPHDETQSVELSVRPFEIEQEVCCLIARVA